VGYASCMSLSRTTTRTLDLTDEHPRVELPKFYSKSRFRVTRIREELNEGGLHSAGYSVRLSGPVVTARGVDHASQRGEQDYRGVASTAYRVGLDRFPAELEHLLFYGGRLATAEFD